MEYANLVDLLGNFAFPIAIVIILLLFMAKILKSYKDSVEAQKNDIKELNKQYHDDYAKITEALNNNTKALETMNKLVEFMVRDDDRK